MLEFSNQGNLFKSMNEVTLIDYCIEILIRIYHIKLKGDNKVRILRLNFFQYHQNFEQRFSIILRS